VAKNPTVIQAYLGERYAASRQADVPQDAQT
jgi:hypothetical protein